MSKSSKVYKIDLKVIGKNLKNLRDIHWHCIWTTFFLKSLIVTPPILITFGIASETPYYSTIYANTNINKLHTITTNFIYY